MAKFNVTIGSDTYEYSSLTIGQLRKKIRPLRRRLDGITLDNDALSEMLPTITDKDERTEMYNKIESLEDEMLDISIDMLVVILARSNEKFNIDKDDTNYAEIIDIISDNLEMDELSNVIGNACGSGDKTVEPFRG